MSRRRFFSQASWISLGQWSTYQIDEPQPRPQSWWYDSDGNVSSVSHPPIVVIRARCLLFGIVPLATDVARTFQLSRARLSLSHVLLGLDCASGELTGLTYLFLDGRLDGTIPTEM
jgi:hypothetical protein